MSANLVNDRADAHNDDAPEAPGGPAGGRLSGRARLRRSLVLAAVFVCAACGLVYELALVALGSYLLGNTITQASVVLALMVFAMGIGSLAAKPLTRHAAVAFAAVEIVLALVGGTSVLVLYAAFAWWSLYQPMLVVLALAIGLLIGAEIPLLMTLLQRIRRQEASSAVADLFAADYVGALVGGMAFPFVLLPWLGLLEGTLVVGAVNAAAGAAVTLGLFRTSIGRRARVLVAGALVLTLATLLALAGLASTFEATARQRIFRDPVVHSERSAYQEIVVTRSMKGKDTRLFLNGDLQFSSVDEYRYHEALVHPAMSGRRQRALVLGGGDGLAARELLGYDDVASVTLVDLDPAVVRLARQDPTLRTLNDDAFADPRLHVVHADAFAWLRANQQEFDVVIADMPDADDVATAKLYSVETYGLVRRALAPGGRVVVQAGSPYFAPEAYWTTAASLRAAGLSPTAYHVDVPSFGDWGFFLATHGPAPELRMPADAPTTRFLDADTLEAAQTFPKDRAAMPLSPSTLLEPTILERQGNWQGY
ncbi:spermidine synthase [Knoellia sinensis KCTC 19936]|uniref:Polyamine aminopropyltransferase n=1 Tax=Knoellia sinensis KCTC 19936 TaxID=1385520 RepID=A0A0A0J9H6_9MICO|nr:polyamine aminopropyltransferase [Knoellia sinensis]KGN33803.1 spermidine synthase [Knoellia sinensis KCTC 19936]